MQFGLNRDIDGAARDVQAAINAARADLPASLRSNPTYHKVNPADAPILILALTSKTLTAGQLYDSAATVLQQSLSQVDGVGEVDVSGSANPAVRVELEPQALFHYGIGLEDVRAALAAANANSPKGSIEFGANRVQIYTNDQASKASQYKDLVIAYRNGAAVKLSDVAEVVDSVEDLRNLGLFNGKRSVLVILYRQPGANIIDTIDRVMAMLPQLHASLPADVDIAPAADRSTTIRASLKDTERTLLIAVALVVMVVFLFLRNWRATLIPSVAVPISIIGTFGAMYMLGFSIDNLSLMALTIATGFVVDDAIVVLENISRHIENGVPRMKAAFLGAREVGFTVLSISISLVAVFLPILLMGGIVGRLFREFALTLSLAIGVSLIVSLTLTPMMCSRLLREPHEKQEEGRFGRWLESGFSSDASRLRAHARLGTAASAPDRDDPAADDRTEYLAVHHRAEGFLSAAGHRAVDRRHPGRSEHLIPGDEGQVCGDDGNRRQESGGGQRGRFHRRPADQFGLHVRLAETEERAQAIRRRGDPATARPARRRGRRADVPAGGAGHSRRRPAIERAVPVHAAGRFDAGPVPVGTEAH